MFVSCRRWAWMILTIGMIGCSRSPAPLVGTGAREAVQGYYEGLVSRDWQQAYASLHPDSQKRTTPEQFARLGQVFRRDLGFDSAEVKVLSCDEKGEEAIARVVLIGRKTSHQRRYKDGVVLRKSGGSWRVVMPVNFGQKSR